MQTISNINQDTQNTSNTKIEPLIWLDELHTAINSVICRAGKNTNNIAQHSIDIDNFEDKSIDLEEAFSSFESLLLKIRMLNNSVWWIGNGGSASICSHLSQDMLNKLKIRSMSLNDPSLITCMSNDFGYENVFKRPLELLADKGDLLIAISSSGNSENIVSCVEMAANKGLYVVTLSGFNSNNRLWRAKSDISFYLPSHFYGIVEVGHEALLHAVIESLFLKEQNINNSIATYLTKTI